MPTAATPTSLSLGATLRRLSPLDWLIFVGLAGALGGVAVQFLLALMAPI